MNVLNIFNWGLWTVGADSSKAKQVRRDAKALAQLLDEKSKAYEDLAEAEKKKSVKEVSKALDEFIALLKEEEDRTIDIVKMELILQLHQVEDLSGLWKALAKRRSKEEESQFHTKIEDVMKKIKSLLEKSKTDIASARADARSLAGSVAAVTRFGTTKDEEILIQNIRKYARRERRNAVRTDEVKALKKELEKRISKSAIEKVEEDLAAEEQLEQEEYQVEHWAYILVTYLMQEFAKIKAGITKLQQSGFPQDILQEKAAELEKLSVNLHHLLIDLVEMNDTVKAQAK